MQSEADVLSGFSWTSAGELRRCLSSPWGGVDSCLRVQPPPPHLQSGAAAEAAELICSFSAAALFGKTPESFS